MQSMMIVCYRERRFSRSSSSNDSDHFSSGNIAIDTFHHQIQSFAVPFFRKINNKNNDRHSWLQIRPQWHNNSHSVTQTHVHSHALSILHTLSLLFSDWSSVMCRQFMVVEIGDDTQTHTRIDACTHTRTHVHTHTNKHARTHTNTWASSPNFLYHGSTFYRCWDWRYLFKSSNMPELAGLFGIHF